MKAAHRGFSLVEIVLAMGIISFSFMAILGLVSIGLNTNRKALDDNLIAAMAHQTMGSLRQQPITNNTLFSGVSPDVTTTIETVYFNSNGVMVSANSSGFDQPIYQCTITAVSNTTALGPSPKVGVKTPCLLDLALTFQWPLVNGKASPSGKTNRYIVHGSLSRYN